MSKSSWAKGELIGGPAPEVKFIWTSTGASPKSLADLKGKVVLIDFWATWCGPCVASFPKVRELQDRYKDFPVAIVGVTSIQGFSIERSGPKPQRIDTKGDQQKEFDLMTAFMKDTNMTWPVVFSEDSCFNPSFGVRGIPHLAIIDPNGVVRFNGLRPGNPAEEAAKIDAILKEFKLAGPAKPMGEKMEEEKKEAPPGK
jgi:thiol-disulfide isomerase/thioredoxin